MLSSIFQQRGHGREVSIAREIRSGMQAAGFRTFRGSIPRIAAELQRCRRYEHPLGAVVVGVEAPPRTAVGGGSFEPASSPLLECLAFVLLGFLLRDSTRESDLVAYAAEDHTYALFLPEADEVAARNAAVRLAAMFRDRTGLELRVGVAEFPRDAFTVEDLYARARAAQEANPVNLEPEREREVANG